MSSSPLIAPRRRAPRTGTLAAVIAALALAAAPRAAAAQAVPSASQDTSRNSPGDTLSPASAPVAECFGFAFGPWSPALNWRAAGHGADAPSVRLAGEFASRDSAGGGRQLLLFPSWWPAGVGVRLAQAPRMLGDTVSGVAHAFVADGRLATPSSTVRAWLKPCGGGARPD